MEENEGSGIKQSQYRGVIWHKRASKWWARHQFKGNLIDLGYFDSEHEAGVHILKQRIALEEADLKIAERALRVEKRRSIKTVGRKDAESTEESRSYEPKSDTVGDYAYRNPESNQAT